MSCCGPNVPIIDGKRKLEALKKFKNKKINLNLNPQYKLEFDVERATWDKYLGDTTLQHQNDIDIDLEEKIKQQYQEIELLQKKYLQKLAKLLLMTQSHCEIKNSILESFEKNLSIPKENILNENMEIQHETKVKTINEHEINVNQFYDEPEIKTSIIKGTEMVPTN